MDTTTDHFTPLALRVRANKKKVSNSTGSPTEMIDYIAICI